MASAFVPRRDQNQEVGMFEREAIRLLLQGPIRRFSDLRIFSQKIIDFR